MKGVVLRSIASDRASVSLRVKVVTLRREAEEDNDQESKILRGHGKSHRAGKRAKAQDSYCNRRPETV